MDIAKLSQLGTLKKFKRNEYCFWEGDRGDDMYILLKGEIELVIATKKGSQTVAKLTPGSFFGEMSLLEGLPRSCSAKALDDTVALAIDRHRFEEFIQAEPGIVYKIMKSLSNRIREQNKVVFDTPFISQHYAPGAGYAPPPSKDWKS